MDHFDVIVIGGGHAGAEAASAAARMGARTLLLTQSLETIGQMSCNPAVGGIAKGTLVREVDALGGVMGRATDLATIQFRMLNRSKGPAVWSPRAQCDRGLYRRAVRRLLERRSNLRFAQGTVGDLRWERDRVEVMTSEGRRFDGRAVVLTAGTFLRGRIHLGLSYTLPAGRAGESPAEGLSQVIETLGLTVERFKTGTPPRIDGRTVDLSRLQLQAGETDPYWFSSFERAEKLPQLPCYLTFAGEAVKDIIRENLANSALYGGAISGRGPRYCPSVEDKIVKFPDASRHQVFLEPEGLETTEMYVNGLSTSLPPQVQRRFLRAVPGLEQVEMTRPGYAIEYDYFPPTQLRDTLEVRALPGVFFAGQINGTTGYEEAAAQGIIAGINAAARALEKDPLVLRRDQALIGVLIDDLVTRGVDEPYRMFTSRAEYRLLLRQDNALRRLFPTAAGLGLLTEEEVRHAGQRLGLEDSVLGTARSASVDSVQANAILASAGETPALGGQRVSDLVKRPGVKLQHALAIAGISADDESLHWAEIELKYEGYISRERASAERLLDMDGFALPENLQYHSMRTISFEAREKLAQRRPGTLGLASRIPGVSPSDLQALLFEVVKCREGEPPGCFT